MGLPGLFIFVGEFLATIGIVINNIFAAILSVLASVLTVTYMILLYNRIIFGTLKIHYIKYFKDLSLKDFIILFLLASFTLFFGLYPQFLIQNLEFSILNTIRLYDI